MFEASECAVMSKITHLTFKDLINVATIDLGLSKISEIEVDAFAATPKVDVRF